MSENERPNVITNVTPIELYAALAKGVQTVLGLTLSRESLLVLLAHVHFETGGGQSMHCFNLGNVQHVKGDGRDYCKFLAGEVIQGRTVTLVEAFRAFGTLDDGVADYLKIVHGQFGYAWPAVENADPEDFAMRLRARGYYTADPGVYSRGMRARYDLCARIIPAPDANVVTVDGVQSGATDTEIEREVTDGTLSGGEES